ncbi:MAG TPA: SDR family oxidoreductase [Gemmatimonadales bacterium]|nr:SDR family oxidoreductase [Gemmatimonadales bacterium]
MLPLNGRRALVCGSTQGIGKASAIAIAEAGATVVLLARNSDQLRMVREALPAPGGAVHEFLSADFSDPAVVRATVRGYLGGRPPFHILVNNTGGPPPGPVLDATEEAFRAAFGMHLFTNHALVQLLVPGMRAEKYGRIINVISTSVREPIKGLGVSNTVRAAVAGWAKTLSKEVAADGITVNNILPGYTRTARLASLVSGRVKATGASQEDIEQSMMADIPAGRFAEPAELGAVVAFLASPAAGYVTGVSLPVDGGRLASI